MDYKNSRVRSNNVLSLVQTALMTAMVFVATSVLYIPYSSNGVIHLGDSVVFIAAVLIGKKRGAVAAGLGMALFDLMHPEYAFWAPFTLVIKALMAFIAGSIAYRGDFNGESVKNNLFGFIAGGIWMVAGYFGAILIIDKFITHEHPVFSLLWVFAVQKIPGDILQVVAGIIIALPICKMLKKNKMFSN